MTKHSIEISEVGPRDGLQSIDSIMPTADKKAWIKAQAEAGTPEIEVGSFVPAKLLPQLADTGEVVEYAKTIPNLNVAVLVPNLYGTKSAIEHGADKITLPFSMSETHSLKNLRRTHAQVIDEIKNISALISDAPKEKRPVFEVSMSTAFGCTLEGHVPEDYVYKMASTAVELGADEIGLSDTTGYGNPAQVKRMCLKIRSELGDDKLTGVHLHNTRGQGLANVMAALDAGITTFDSSLGGLGGCPFAPGASGNIVTEDLVFLLEAMGLNTGIDMDKLIEVHKLVQHALPNEEMYGFLADAGVPKDFKTAIEQ